MTGVSMADPHAPCSVDGDALTDALALARRRSPIEIEERYGELADWIRRTACAVWSGPWGLHDLRSSDPPDPPPGARSVAGVIITGSISSVGRRSNRLRPGARPRSRAARVSRGCDRARS